MWLCTKLSQSRVSFVLLAGLRKRLLRCSPSHPTSTSSGSGGENRRVCAIEEPVPTPIDASERIPGGRVGLTTSRARRGRCRGWRRCGRRFRRSGRRRSQQRCWPRATWGGGRWRCCAASRMLRGRWWSLRARTCDGGTVVPGAGVDVIRDGELAGSRSASLRAPPISHFLVEARGEPDVTTRASIGLSRASSDQFPAWVGIVEQRSRDGHPRAQAADPCPHLRGHRGTLARWQTRRPPVRPRHTRAPIWSSEATLVRLGSGTKFCCAEAPSSR